VVGRPGEFLLFAFALVHLVVTYALAMIAFWGWSGQTRAARALVVAAGCLVGYFVLLASGPEAYPRFRTPIAPLLAILAGVGWHHLRWGVGRDPVAPRSQAAAR
jgi:hypothetical protein